jgi:diguanylate cyclase (GGDEF)-like protein/PAS domain S-box-containing protein
MIQDPAEQDPALELEQLLASRTFLDSLAEGLVLQGPDGAIVDGNETALRLLGLTRDQFLGRDSYDPEWQAVREDGSPFPGHDHPAMVTLRTGEPLHDVLMGIDSHDQKRRWLSISSQLITGEGGTIGVSTSFINVTETKLAKEKLTYQATHDLLTHLVNRRDLFRKADEIATYVQRSGERVGLLYIDVDGLKSINDSFGHAAGDQALIAVAERLNSACRSSDIVSRIGGDEFVVLLVGLQSINDAEAIANKIVSANEDLVQIDDSSSTVSVSIGVAIAEIGEDVDETLRHADAALYRAKDQGRGRAATYDTSVDD